MVGVGGGALNGIFAAGGSGFAGLFAGCGLAATGQQRGVQRWILDCDSGRAAAIYGKYADGDFAAAGAQKYPHGEKSTAFVGRGVGGEYCGHVPFRFCAGEAQFP